MSDSLVVVWTSGDREVANELLLQDHELQSSVKEMIAEGITVEACLRCAENYNAVEPLKQLGIDVKLMGIPLSDYLKEGRKVLTF